VVVVSTPRVREPVRCHKSSHLWLRKADVTLGVLVYEGMELRRPWPIEGDAAITVVRLSSEGKRERGLCEGDRIIAIEGIPAEEFQYLPLERFMPRLPDVSPP